MTTKHGFELVREQQIPEVNSLARLWRHVTTGAKLLSMEGADDNKTFGVAFATPPITSNGVAHIMEHAVLSGSHKYPVKELFIELVKGSLQTFLNAWTFSDKTVYPLASQNLQDFYNLIDVYLDAVFYPRLSPQVFHQEGWHYELDDPNAPLTFKGVVFNEMKGAYSEPDNLMARLAQQSLFPDTPYGVDSGGDPAEIPTLTWEEFKTFHDTYYHPSNARFFFYGDDDPDERLRIIDAALGGFERLEINALPALQDRFQAPKRLEEQYDAGEKNSDSQKTILTMNWMLSESTDVETTLALSILNHILTETPASPLRKALIDSGLGDDLAGTGLDTDIRQVYFSTGLKGIAYADADKVETLILDTLRELAENGIEPDMVAASLNTVEFALRENNTGSYPRGIFALLRALGAWLYGGDPLAALAFDPPLASIKTQAAEGLYFERLIRTYLLDNPHRTTVILTPDPGVKEARDRAERERLEQARAAMSADDLRRLVEETHTLRRIQETPDSPEALAAIPSLALDDLDREIKTIPLAVFDHNRIPLLYHDLFTNGIVYLDLGFDLHSLPADDLPWIGLFGRALLEMGTETEDFVRLSQRIGRTTGGIAPATFTSMPRQEGDSVAWLILRGKATLDHSHDLLAILSDVLLTARLDNPARFRQIVLEERAGFESEMLYYGHAVVNTRIKAQFNAAHWAAEQMGGVEFLFFLRQLVDQIDQDWPAVLARLEAIRQRLVNRAAMLANVTLDGDNWPTFEPELKAFLDRLPSAPPVRPPWTPAFVPTHEGLTIPAQVNYVGKGINLYDRGYTLHGSVGVVARLLETGYLWERIRMQGGAYGVFMPFDSRSGVLTLISYRDPNLLNTLAVYDQAGAFLRGMELDQDTLVKAIIGTIGTLDTYQLPDAKGYTSMQRFLIGETDTFRQQFRDQVLSTTLDDLHAFGEALEALGQQGVVAVLGSPDAIQAANATQDGGWLKPIRVL